MSETNHAAVEMQDSRRSIEFLRRLAFVGLDDLVVLRPETAAKVGTEERSRLVREIATEDIESIRDLARRTGRDPSAVSRDLALLKESNVIEFVKEGRSKRPILAHENIFVAPLVFEGRHYNALHERRSKQEDRQ